MSLKFEIIDKAQVPQRETAPSERAASRAAPRFKPFLVPLGDDPVARIKPWPTAIRIPLLAACAALSWAVPVGAWLLLHGIHV